MLETVNLTRSFGQYRAVDQVSLTIESGEILGLAGENGAGKSTLLSLLAGMQTPDGGDIRIDHTTVRFGSPADARRAGIAIAYQHFSLVPTFTIREQLRLSGWRGPALPDILDERFSGNEIIGELSLGEQQRVEIAKALLTRPRILLLDEPTSILSASETDNLLEIMRCVSAMGTSVVFVTHKMHEALNVCDRIVALRLGKVTGTLVKGTNGWVPGSEKTLLGYMFGSIASPEAEVVARDFEHRPLFELEQISTSATTTTRSLSQVSFDLGSGEILAIVGIDGQGQRELAEVCSGYRSADGQIRLRKRELAVGRVHVFDRAGIGYLSDDRLGEGTFPQATIEDALILKQQRTKAFSQHGRLRRKAIREHAKEQIERWKIVPARSTARIETLSGGNVQKVVLARELSRPLSVLIANKPTYGLDVPTRDMIWSAIHAFADRGSGVIVFSPDLEEALEHGDRVAVITDGRLSTPQLTSHAVRSELEEMMVSGW